MSVEFPFTDMQGRKRRPGVVLGGDASDLLLARITTHEPRDPFDVRIEEWASVGLPKPSTIRLLKLISLDGRLVHHTIGHLAAGDRTRLADAVQRLGQEIVATLRVS